MNKTLLLIICDFLLLNLLALTRWENAAPPRAPVTTPSAQRSEAAAPQINADMVELMRVSLEDERASREQLAGQLAETKGALQQREENVAALRQQKAQLESSLTSASGETRQLEQKLATTTQEATLSKEQLAKMQRELDERRAEAERQKQQVAALERQNTEARQRIENLNVAVRVAEQQTQMVTHSLDEAKQQIEVERQERARVQEQTTQLVQGVGALAEKSGELTQEIRESRPVNSNIIFSEFLANRVQTSIASQRPGLFAPSVRDKSSQTILVSDGLQTYALMHLSDTPFSFQFENPPNYERITGRLSHGSVSVEVQEIQFLALDPRVVVVPLDTAAALRMGAKIYRLAAEPFKFPEAVLVRAGDGVFGETPFRLDGQNTGYVKVDNRIVTRLFGEFAPKQGDLMFSKSGDLIGIMANDTYCVVLGSFRASQTLAVGEASAGASTGPAFSDLAARWQRLPIRLQ